MVAPPIPFTHSPFDSSFLVLPQFGEGSHICLGDKAHPQFSFQSEDGPKNQNKLEKTQSKHKNKDADPRIPLFFS